MLVCRYADGGRPGHGRVDLDDGRVVPVEYEPAVARWVSRPGPARPLGEVTLLPPAKPSKIVCVALNHPPATRSGSCPVVLKPPSSLVAHEEPVRHPGGVWQLRHEAELAVVIGVRCVRVRPGDAASVIAGYTCANDITAYADPPDAVAVPWAKHFDGLSPIGPWLATDLDPADAEITCRVDGEVRQQGRTGDLLVGIPEIVAQVSEHTTLLPGDVILTGTPPGSGPLAVGSRVEVSIPGVGTLRNVIDPPVTLSGAGRGRGRNAVIDA